MWGGFGHGEASVLRPLLGLQDTVYFVKGAFQEELVMQGRGKEPQAWLDSFDAVTPCTVEEVRRPWT